MEYDHCSCTCFPNNATLHTPDDVENALTGVAIGVVSLFAIVSVFAIIIVVLRCAKRSKKMEVEMESEMMDTNPIQEPPSPRVPPLV
ncbi:MAG: hypothetical protein ACTSUE_08105 [Promethearchaeota archaeon]